MIEFFASANSGTDFSFDPELAVRLYRSHQLDVFFFCPFTRKSSHLVDDGI
jgi:hypothetical protein